MSEARLPRSLPWLHVADAGGTIQISETRPDIRIRIRSVVIRIRVRNTSIRIRIVTTTIQHTVAGDSALKLFIIVDCALRSTIPR